MWLKLLFYTTLVTLTVRAEPPAPRFAPYAAAGWRPQRPFHLPGEYLPPSPPLEVDSNSRQRQNPVDFEISKARVDYVGQVQQQAFSSNSRQPKKQYEAPNKQQELPYETTSQQYKPQRPFFPSQDTQQVQPSRKPAQKYGPPQSVNFNIIYPDPRSLEESTFASGGDITDFEAVERNQRPAAFEGAGNSARSRQGQYYVLGPDNTVQRVIFTTSQDEEEQRTNGFTAQLKYTPVGELKDPVFRYNNKGQLVRVLKK